MYVVNGTVSSQYILCTDQIVNYACETSLQESTLFKYRSLVDFIKGRFRDFNRMKNGHKSVLKKSLKHFKSISNWICYLEGSQM